MALLETLNRYRLCQHHLDKITCTDIPGIYYFTVKTNVNISAYISV